MSGPTRNPDKLNTIGVVVVGICGAVLVYVSIVALQAFYMNDTSEVQTMADYGGQDTAHQSLRATQMSTIEECTPNAKPQPGQNQTYRIPIKYAIKMVADEAKVDPANLVPSQGRSEKATILPIFGRPKAIKAPATDAGGGAGSSAPNGGASAPMTPTGGQGPGGGQPTGQAPGTGTGTGTNNATNNGAGSATTPEPAKTAPAGGNPPTPDPKTGVSDPKAGTAPPKAGGTAPKAGSAKGSGTK